MAMHLGESFGEALQYFKLAVRNRRIKVSDDCREQFCPVFSGKLWKVKAGGERMREEDWFEREMWIAKNGSLVYWSKKEDRELVYYTGHDISRATFTRVPNADSCRQWSFQVHLAPVADGV